jgi:hypothetical protein
MSCHQSTLARYELAMSDRSKHNKRQQNTTFSGILNKIELCIFNSLHGQFLQSALQRSRPNWSTRKMQWGRHTFQHNPNENNNSLTRFASGLTGSLGSPSSGPKPGVLCW